MIHAYHTKKKEELSKIVLEAACKYVLVILCDVKLRINIDLYVTSEQKQFKLTSGSP